MYHIVYLTTNIVNNKMYVGVHSTYNLNDGYIGSGYALKSAISKYGIQNFTRQILHYCLTEEDSLIFESLIVNESFISRADTYNIKLGGGNKVHHTKAIRQKISDKLKGRTRSESSKLKQSNTVLGLNNPFYGKTHSTTTKQKLAELNKDKDMSVLCELAKISNTGKKRSVEICQNISQYRKNQFPPKAVKYKLTNVEGIEFIVHGELLKFANDHNLSISLLKRFIDCGVIIAKQAKQSTQVKNTVGWMIQRL